LRARVEDQLRKIGLLPHAYFDHNVYSHDYLVAHMLAKPWPQYTRFRCVTPSWDNGAAGKRRVGHSQIQTEGL